MSYIGLILLIVFSVAVPPFFLDQTEVRRAEKTFSDIWMTAQPPPPPPYLNVWTYHWFLLKMQKRTQPIFSHLDLTLGQ